MIKIEVNKNNISFIGHANFDEYGKDIVCAAASSVVITSIEAMASFDINSVDVTKTKDRLEIKINKDDKITKTLVKNMLDCLTELEQKYPKNIKITNKEE